MTSEQIKTLCLQVATMGAKADDGGHVALSLMQTQAMWEVALQLAIFNEGPATIERERCAKLAEKYIGGGDPNWDLACEHISEEIRK